MKYSLNIRDIYPVIFLAGLLFLVIVLYLPGLNGGFLFDDFPNLEELGAYGGVVNFETFKNFVFHGIASPLGRPVSLATFLLDDNTWPSHAEWFKTTNLKIHLLTGLLLCWATLNLLRLMGYQESNAIWISLLSGGVWLLHPYMLSTTLYVVQRMAQLAALFVFAGLAGYFHGRLLLLKNAKISAYLWMSASLAIATPLALMSKENGVLLPMLVLVAHACLPKNIVAPTVSWRILFLWIPTFAICLMLLKEVNFAPDAWPNRPFNQVERLLTEPRIIWEYLYQLYVPHIEGRGLFQDGFAFSKGLLTPPSTIVALFSLIFLMALAIYKRYQYPLVSLAILFYLVAHLLESTLIGLELYFEHRNYLSAAFLFLPIVTGIVNLREKIRLSLVVCLVILLLSMLSFLTYERSKLWSNTLKLEVYWAASTPESPRAQNRLGSLMLDEGRIDESIRFMKESVERFPKSSLLTINLLLIQVYSERASESDFIACATKMKLQPFDAQAVVGLRNLVDRAIRKSKIHKEYLTYTLALLNDVSLNKNYSSLYLYKKLVPYLKAEIYLSMDDFEEAYNQFSIAIPMYGDADAALSMVAEMANANRFVEALLLFKQAETVYKNQSDNSLKRSRTLYDFEFARMKKTIEENLAELGIQSVDATVAEPSGEHNHVEHSNSSQK